MSTSVAYDWPHLQKQIVSSCMLMRASATLATLCISIIVLAHTVQAQSLHDWVPPVGSTYTYDYSYRYSWWHDFQYSDYSIAFKLVEVVEVRPDSLTLKFHAIRGSDSSISLRTIYYNDSGQVMLDQHNLTTALDTQIIYNQSPLEVKLTQGGNKTTRIAYATGLRWIALSEYSYNDFKMGIVESESHTYRLTKVELGVASLARRQPKHVAVEGGQLNIPSIVGERLHVQVVDMIGKIVRTFSVTASDDVTRINLEPLRAGCYIVAVDVEGDRYSLKLIQ